MTAIADLLRQMRAAAEAATPGKWRAGSVERYHVFVPCTDPCCCGDERVLLLNQHFPHEADAAHIATAHPANVLAVLDALAKAQRQLAAATEVNDRIVTILDEAAGMQPVMSAEEALTQLEAHLYSMRTDLATARAALSRAPDLIRGRKAWLWSTTMGGMGGNIATEAAGRFNSPSKWAEFERLVDEALKEDA